MHSCQHCRQSSEEDCTATNVRSGPSTVIKRCLRQVRSDATSRHWLAPLAGLFGAIRRHPNVACGGNQSTGFQLTSKQMANHDIAIVVCGHALTATPRTAP